MPISRIGKRKMIYRLLIKNFILLSLLVFLSLSLNLLCVHLMFRGGKYNPSEISALNVFTMFWTNHPLLNNFVHILITCIIYGIMGMFCCATSFYFRNRKTVYFVSIFFWLIEILKPGSLHSHQLYCFFMQICYCKIKYIFWKILCCQLTIYTKGKP